MSVGGRLWQRLVGDRPIVTRLVVAVAVAMSLVLALSAAFVYWRVSFALGRQVDQDLAAYQQEVHRGLRAGDPLPKGTPGLTFQVYDGHGRLRSQGQVAPRLLTRQQVVHVMAGGQERFDVGRFLPPSRHAYRVAATRVQTPRGARVVAVAISRHKHDEALRELLAQLAIADLIALLAASFVGYRTARAALDPVERYRRAAAEAPERGVTRLPVDDRDDELTRLGHTLNELLARIEASSERERRFLADASHELRSPLSLMSTELEWVRHRPRSPHELEVFLDSMQAQVRRLVDLANALLELEEVRSDQPHQLQTVSLRELVQDAVQLAAPRDAVAVDVPDEPATVDSRWVTLAVGNLVTNAVRHGDGQVTVSAEVDGGWVRIAVRDQGGGFSPEFAQHAFDRFSRADDSRTTPGNGLGLALVQAVASAHGGSAEIDAAAEGGVVVMTLRRHPIV